MTYTDPNSRASIRFSYNGCVGCVDKGMVEGSDDVGVPYPEAYVPEDAIAQQRLSDWAIAFATTAPDPGFSTDGLIKVIDDGGPAGAIVVEVTLPTSQHSVATEILNSV